MNILVVYGSQFGTTERLARIIGAALEPRHRVQVVKAREAQDRTGDGVDLLLVGAPTQMHGLRLLVRSFLTGLARRRFSGIAAAAFDTRMEGPRQQTGSAATMIAERLEAAGCRVVVPAESFIVADLQGPLAAGEEERARTWALTVIEALAVPSY